MKSSERRESGGAGRLTLRAFALRERVVTMRASDGAMALERGLQELAPSLIGCDAAPVEIFQHVRADPDGDRDARFAL